MMKTQTNAPKESETNKTTKTLGKGTPGNNAGFEIFQGNDGVEQERSCQQHCGNLLRLFAACE